MGGFTGLARLAVAATLMLVAAGTDATARTDGGPAPSFLKNVDGRLFFATYEPSGWRLWTSDGTVAGTIPLAGDLGLDVELVPVDSTLVFSTRGALWTSDGTPEGTVVVTELPFYPTGIKNVQGTVYFSDGNGELWRSDLTADGTERVAEIPPYYVFHDLTPAAITGVKDRVFFRAIDLEHGSELWTSDGTSAGTHVIDINPNLISGSSPESFINFAGTLLFAADDGTSGQELWTSDGTDAGTVQVADINPTGDAWPINLRAVGRTVFFSADDGSGAELWKTDGSAAGTVPVADINPSGGSFPNALLNVDGTVYFRADDGTTGIELWKSDGTEAGTVRVADINPAGHSTPASLHQIKGRLFFTADDGVHGEELWTSDGTSAGTVMVADLDPNGSSQPHYIVNVADELYFAANDGESGTQLWTLECAVAGWPCTPRLIPLPAPPSAPGAEPFLVKDINPGPDDGEPYYLTASGGRLFFQAFRPDTGNELWTSDGTDGGTRLVRDINPGPADSHPNAFTDVDGIVYFLAESADGSGLWKSDGTEAGTTLVHNVDWRYGSPTFAHLTAFHGALYYSVDAPGGIGVWRTDGDATELIVPGVADDIGVAGDVLYFIAGHPTVPQYALWRSDGTTAGSVPLVVLQGESGRGQLTAAGDRLFFRANETLWTSDGTPGGTIRLPAKPQGITAVGNKIFFSAPTYLDSRQLGRELWKSDGTVAGTQLVADINPGVSDALPGRLTNVNGTLFFWATDGRTGFELWRSDGTPLGTRLVRDIDPTDVTVPSYFQAVGDTLYFTAHTPSFGYELWRSDGTFEGTSIVKNLNLVRSSYPESPAVIGNTLFFYADDGRVGEELWALSPCGDGVLDAGEACDDGNVADRDGCSAVCRLEPIEQCGNCTDDDGDTLIDLEDPDCCADSGTLSIDRFRLGRRGERRKLKLDTTIQGLDLEALSSTPFDAMIQLRGSDGAPFCAKVPAERFRQARRAKRFEDPHATFADARGITHLTVRLRKTGSVKLAAVGKIAGVDGSGEFSIIVGLGAADARSCSAIEAQPGRVRARARR